MFRIDSGVVREHWQALLPLMENFVVVRTECRFDLNAIEYTALSPMFDEVPEYTVPPEYQVEFLLKPGIPAVLEVSRLNKKAEPKHVTRRLVFDEG
ncbi:MAG: hypothetical protein KGL39_03125 [Patescibacteria group bacterium]|nr:hypothetical protein [Patescibacteria group bacterium]